MRILGPTFLAALVPLLSTMSCDKDQPVFCDRLSNEAQVAVGTDQVQAAHDLGCNTASDCVLAPTSTSCSPGCDVVLTQAGATQLKAALAQVDSMTCSVFASNGCQPAAAPSCTTLFPACVAGACVALTAPPADDGGTEADVVAPGEDATTDAIDDGCSSCNASDSSEASTDGAGPDGAADVVVPDAAPADAGGG